jgi:hypothetical protein
MNTITIEPGLSDKLVELPGQVILCDPNGRAIGFFLPMRDRPHLKDLQLEPPSTVEEINQRRKNRSGKPLEEILNRLGIQ